MKITQFLFLSFLLIFLSCSKKQNGEKESGQQDEVQQETEQSVGELNQSWIDESEMDNLSNNWVDERDKGELSSTWTEDAFAEELESSSGLANSWVDESGEAIFRKADVPPEFIGGKEALFDYFVNNLQYPDDVEEGVVYVAFVVGSDGKIRDARVFKGVKESMDREALRIINNMPSWDPGIKDGEPVASVYGLPIIYRP
jgi:TonB family protein